MCPLSQENLQALNLVLHPQHMECKQLTASKSDGKLSKTQSQKFILTKEEKRIKVQNDVPFGYAIENIIYVEQK